MSEHLTYLREVLENDAIGLGEDFQFQDAVEYLEALEHASEQYRKAMSDQAKRIERLENLFPAILLYLEDQADVVDGDNGIPAPNRAMSLLVWTKHALEGKDG
jgi:hypothetical protein